mmetsp:Transcript_69443/g.196028  ORF Transcript_69443/g.196028 Transcript_69443/m.196028 type:complete len:347 (-) Transcript_69443:11-1051(-)
MSVPESPLIAYRREFLEAEGTPLAIELRPGRRYGLVATADVEEQSCLLAEAPLALVQTHASRSSTPACSRCLCPFAAARGAEDLGEMVCCACGDRYCSEACRRLAWSAEHELLCPAAGPSAEGAGREAAVALRRLLSELPNIGEAFELAIRLLALSAHEEVELAEGEQRPVVGPRLWSLLQGLAGSAWWETVRFERGQLEEARRVTQQVLELAKEVLSGQALLPDVGSDAFAHLVGQVRMNAVEVVVPPEDDEDESGQSAAGIALHLVASAVNHECEAKCAVQTALPLPELRGWAVLQALSPLSVGSEVTISYAAGPRAERRAALSEQWLFECGCAACEAADGTSG